MDEQFYTAKEVAKILKVTYMTIFRWIKAGKLEVHKIGKQYRIKKSDFESFIKKSKS